LFNYRSSIPSSLLQYSQRLIICTHTIYVIVRSVVRSFVRVVIVASSQQQALPKGKQGRLQLNLSRIHRAKARKTQRPRKNIDATAGKTSMPKQVSKKNVVGQLPKKVKQIAQVRSLAQTKRMNRRCCHAQVVSSGEGAVFRSMRGRNQMLFFTAVMKDLLRFVSENGSRGSVPPWSRRLRPRVRRGR
jgi:hypothetical protein